MGVPPAAAQEYGSALQQLDLKQFKKYFVVFIIELTELTVLDFC